MKKLTLTFVGLFTVAVPLAVSTAASATTYTCANGFTGPNSDNQCTSTTEYTCTYQGENTVVIDNDNTQVSVSGNATGEGNGQGGNVQTGSATNTNGTVFDVVVTTGDEVSTCVVTATVPATPEKPAPKPVTPPEPAKPAVLAKTSSDAVVTYVLGAAIALGLAAVALRAVVLVYGRQKP